MPEGTFDQTDPTAFPCARCGVPHDLSGLDGDPTDMWRAVVRQALNDAREWFPPRRQAAIRWLHDTEYAPGSFAWICHHTGRHPEAVLKAHKGFIAMPTPADWALHRKKDAARKAASRAKWAVQRERRRARLRARKLSA